VARLFDAYIIVDWSAAARPVTGANSIWVGWLTEATNEKRKFARENPRTRREARTLIETLALDLISRGKRVLIGFDFAMGYPAGTAASLGLDTSQDPAWKAMHLFLSQTIEDHADNSNNRFEFAARLNAVMTSAPHPFWGAPASKASPTLSATKGDFNQSGSLPEHRLSERWIRTQFRAHPKSVWQLLGAGAVGSQSLLGIPTVSYLRARMPGAQIWPFETGFQPMTSKRLENTSCVLAEIYPSTVPITPRTGEILDELQVRMLSERLESLDSAGSLGDAFDFPNSISDRELHKIIDEEGWILAK